jgi:hypothetical protein
MDVKETTFVFKIHSSPQIEEAGFLEKLIKLF